MGNCQAADAAAVVIQHPSSSRNGGGGRVERAYGAVSAAAVMAANPGHYVAEVVRPVATAPPATTSGRQTASAPAARRRLKLLRPDDTLVLGGVYRLVTFEDVLKQFVSKRNATLSRSTIAAADDDDDGHRRRGSCGGEAVAEAGRVPPAKVAAQSHQEDPSSPSPVGEARPEPEPEPEPNLMAAAMALGGRMSLSRHGQWRPALPSIAEGSVVCF